MIQDVTRTIAADDSSIFDLQGASLTCIAATLPDFLIRFDNDPEATFRVGFEYTPPGGFERFEVKNNRSAPLTVTFTVAQGQFRDRRQISSAPQSFEPVTIDDIKGTAYYGTGQAGGVAGPPLTGPQIMLWNPVGSGIIGVLRQTWVSIGSGNFILMGYDNTDTGWTLLRNTTALFTGDPDGKLEVRTRQVEDTGNQGEVATLRTSFDNTLQFLPRTPIILPEGNGLWFQQFLFGAGANLNVFFEPLEVAAG